MGREDELEQSALVLAGHDKAECAEEETADSDSASESDDDDNEDDLAED